MTAKDRQQVGAPVRGQNRGVTASRNRPAAHYERNDSLHRWPDLYRQRGGSHRNPDCTGIWCVATPLSAWVRAGSRCEGYDLHPANLLTADGNFCGVVDFGDMCAGDPACDLAACWMLLPDGAVGRFHQGYSPAADAATLRRARAWALRKALACALIGDAGVHGRQAGKPRGDRQQTQPCDASPRPGPSPRENSPTTVNAPHQTGIDCRELVRQNGLRRSISGSAQLAPGR